MSASRQLHQQAMSLLYEAQVASAAGQANVAARLRRQAFEAERRAANLLSDRPDMEPTRSILYKGAAVIALECGLKTDAQELAQQGLAGNPPEDIMEQLQSVLAKAEVCQ